MENQQPSFQPSPPANPPATSENYNESPKSFIVAWLLSYLLGGLGIDRFYRGFTVRGVIKLLTLGGLGIWTYIDFLMISYGRPLDKQGRVLSGYEHNKQLIRIITTVLLIFSVLVNTSLILLVIFLAVPAVQLSARNFDRTSDVDAISSAISTYSSHTDSQLPASLAGSSSGKTMKLCGTNCGAGGYATIMLRFYNARDISFQPYQANLSVPNDNSVYLVDNASCNNQDTGIGPSTSGDLAVLYATENQNQTINQMCQINY